MARVNGVAYVLDMRLRVLRRVDDPDDVVDFSDECDGEPDGGGCPRPWMSGCVVMMVGEASIRRCVVESTPVRVSWR